MVREMVRVAGNEMGGAGMGSSNDDMGGIAGGECQIKVVNIIHSP